MQDLYKDVVGCILLSLNRPEDDGKFYTEKTFIYLDTLGDNEVLLENLPSSIEEDFGICCEREDLEGMKSINDVVEFVRQGLSPLTL